MRTGARLAQRRAELIGRLERTCTLWKRPYPVDNSVTKLSTDLLLTELHSTRFWTLLARAASAERDSNGNGQSRWDTRNDFASDLDAAPHLPYLRDEARAAGKYDAPIRRAQERLGVGVLHRAPRERCCWRVSSEDAESAPGTPDLGF